MRVLACVLVSITFLARPCLAQTDEGPRAAYVEFGGSTIFYSLNGEVPVAPTRTFRVGAMLLPQVFGVTTSMQQLLGRGDHRVVLGLGVVLVGSPGADFARGTATIGYRHMRRGGSFFQIASTPFITKRGVHRYAGVSFGKSL